jgi:hypothetical protein
MLSAAANPFHIFEWHLLSAAVTEFGCPTIGAAGDTLRHLKVTTILEKT